MAFGKFAIYEQNLRFIEEVRRERIYMIDEGYGRIYLHGWRDHVRGGNGIEMK